MKLKVSIDTEKIMRKRGLGSSRQAMKFFANEVKRLCDPYVPMQQGTLKNSAQVVESGECIEILYNQPYAHYQYYGEIMAGRAPKSYTGKPINYHGAPMRGKEWDKRMMADRGDEAIKALADYVGGKVK